MICVCNDIITHQQNDILFELSFTASTSKSTVETIERVMKYVQS